MTHRELPEWPKERQPYPDAPYKIQFPEELIEYWESRCREAVEALKHYKDMGIGQPPDIWKAHDALSRIGPLPPEETSRE